MKTLKWRLSCRKERRYQKRLITFCVVRNKWDMIIDMYAFTKKRKKYIYLLPCIQPHKLDSVNNCKTNEKKTLQRKSDSSVRLKNRDDINLKTPFCRTSLNIISGFWLITFTVQLYFFIATLKVWIYYNLQLLHTLCI